MLPSPSKLWDLFGDQGCQGPSRGQRRASAPRTCRQAVRGLFSRACPRPIPIRGRRRAEAEAQKAPTTKGISLLGTLRCTFAAPCWKVPPNAQAALAKAVGCLSMHCTAKPTDASAIMGRRVNVGFVGAVLARPDTATACWLRVNSCSLHLAGLEDLSGRGCLTAGTGKSGTRCLWGACGAAKEGAAVCAQTLG